MFENIMRFFRKMTKKENKILNSKEQAKERLHLVLMQDRANVSADFLELMKQEIIDVIKKYIEIDESAIDVRLTNKDNGDGTQGAPALYANIPITKMKDNIGGLKINFKENNKSKEDKNKKDGKEENVRKDNKDSKEMNNCKKEKNTNKNEKNKTVKKAEKKEKKKAENEANKKAENEEILKENNDANIDTNNDKKNNDKLESNVDSKK